MDYFFTTIALPKISYGLRMQRTKNIGLFFVISILLEYVLIPLKVYSVFSVQAIAEKLFSTLKSAALYFSHLRSRGHRRQIEPEAAQKYEVE